MPRRSRPVDGVVVVNGTRRHRGPFRLCTAGPAWWDTGWFGYQRVRVRLTTDHRVVHTVTHWMLRSWNRPSSSSGPAAPERTRRDIAERDITSTTRAQVAPVVRVELHVSRLWAWQDSNLQRRPLGRRFACVELHTQRIISYGMRGYCSFLLICSVKTHRLRIEKVSPLIRSDRLNRTQ